MPKAKKARKNKNGEKKPRNIPAAMWLRETVLYCYRVQLWSPVSTLEDAKQQHAHAFRNLVNICGSLEGNPEVKKYLDGVFEMATKGLKAIGLQELDELAYLCAAFDIICAQVGLDTLDIGIQWEKDKKEIDAIMAGLPEEN